MIRQSTIVKLAITALFIKPVVFLLSTNNNTIDDGTTTSSGAPADMNIFRSKKLFTTKSQELDYEEEWTPRLGEQLGFTKKEYRVKRRQYNWRLRKQEGGLAPLYLFSDELSTNKG